MKKKYIRAKYPHNIKKALARKKCLWQKLKSNPDQTTKENYKLASAKYRLLVRNYEIKKELRIIESKTLVISISLLIKSFHARAVLAP